MSQFSKTLIVDNTLPSYQYPYYRTIREAVDYLKGTDPIPPIPGTILVESGVYRIDGTITPLGVDQRTVEISSNITLIGRGNVVINLVNSNSPEENRSLSAFTNANHTNGNTNITITGFKIVVSPTVEYGTSGNAGVIKLVNVKNCRVEKVHITVDPESGHGVYPGELVGHSERPVPDEDWEKFPASAIRFESTPINNPNKENSTGNIVRQCVISNFGRYMGNNPAVVESGQQRYGIGILFRQGKRNTIKHNQVRGARMCCMVEAEDACVPNSRKSTAKYGRPWP
jgi:hypothetical protein